MEQKSIHAIIVLGVNKFRGVEGCGLTVTKRLKEDFEQYTVTVEFESITLVYLD